MEKELSGFVVEKGPIKYALSIRIGVYCVTDQDLEVSVMFDRAHMALSTIKDNVHVHIAFYDEEIRRKALWERNISVEVQNAIDNKEICPYLQALVDREGRIVGAEALVRWNHPEKGFLIPGLFLANLCASVFAVTYAELMAHLRKCPATLFVVTGVVPMVPGGTLYRTMDCAVNGDLEGASVYGHKTLIVALAIAAGISFVTVCRELRTPKP